MSFDRSQAELICELDSGKLRHICHSFDKFSELRPACITPGDLFRR